MTHSHRFIRRRRLLVIACAALIISGCGDDDTNEQPAPDTAILDTTTTGDTAVEDQSTDAPDVADVPDDADTTPAPLGAVLEPHRECALPDAPARTYDAAVRWTSYGIPHITATDLPDAIFGQGYALAQDHACVLADQIIRARSERARYFGPGEDDANIVSDLGIKALRVRENAVCGFAELPQDIQEILHAYAAGYNHFLAEDTLPPECAGAEWVQEIDGADLLSYYLLLGLRASGVNFIDVIVAAQPPSGNKNAPEKLPAWPDMRDLGIGSNGWGIGAEKSASGRGMVVANPHFPWEGSLRLHESHIRVPGVVDTYGVSLVGVPGVLIGFNRDIAWTHTVSASARFSAYTLSLVEGDPEVYLYDGEPRRMKKREETIEVLQGDGSLATQSQFFYYSHYGPIASFPPLGWSATQVLTLRDANDNLLEMMTQFLSAPQATDLDSFRSVYRDVHGIPWVNVMYADKDGNAFYTDATQVPNFSPEAIAAWAQKLADGDVFTTFAWSIGVFLTDGSDPLFEWLDEPGANGRGTIPFDDAPQLERRDYVFNANDSHWLSHLDARLEGYSPLYGSEQTERSLRTRMNLRFLTEVDPDGASGDDGLFTLDELEAMFFSSRAMSQELARSAVAARCQGASTVMVDDQSVDVTEACAVLAGWDGAMRVESVGAPVWREFWAEYSDSTSPRFATAFDPAAPLETPSGLPDAPAMGDDPVLLALARAVLRLEAAGVALDAPFSDVQHTLKGATRIPISGGTETDGAFNIITYLSSANNTLLPSIPVADSVDSPTHLSTEGYRINYGSSFVMVLEFTDSGPSARAILTYSQSSDSASPHFDDQTQLFSQQTFRPILFEEADIVADPNLTERQISDAP